MEKKYVGLSSGCNLTFGKITRFGLLFLLIAFLTNCETEAPGKKDHKLLDSKDQQKRIAYLQQNLPFQRFGDLKGDVGDYTFTVVATIDPPIIEGTPIQACYLYSDGSKIYVTYNLAGEEYKGAVDIYNYTLDPVATVLTAAYSMEFTTSDINGVAAIPNGADSYEVFLVGSTEGYISSGLTSPAFMIYFDETLTTFDVADIPGYTANSISYDPGADWFSVSSGSNGGLTLMNRTTLLPSGYVPKTNLTSVFNMGDFIYQVVTDPCTIDVFQKSISSDASYNLTGFSADVLQKSSVQVKYGHSFIALNEGGTVIFNNTTHAIAASLTPADPGGVPPEYLVSNGLCVGNYRLFIANGGGGLTIGELDLDMNINVIGNVLTNQSVNHVVMLLEGGNSGYMALVSGKAGLKIVYYTYSGTTPIITTTAATAVTENSALIGGEITDNGGTVVYERGLCWSTHPTPTLDDNTVSKGTGSGVFAHSLAGLAQGTTYYVRAYATNNVGTVYGNEESFTTLTLPTVTTTPASSITDVSAASGGEVTLDGGTAVTARGVCWSTSHDPTTANSKTTDGSGTGLFTSSITGLTKDVTYYVRAYATNSVGTAYGIEESFTTLTLPTVTTTAASSITDVSASSGGEVTSDGGFPVTARGVCWSTSPNPTTANSKTTDGSGTGSFTSSITGLTSDVTYYVRAYATNSVGTAYGNEEVFTTLTVPTLTTTAATSITDVSASSGGEVTSDGGTAVTARGVCWSTSSSPTTADDLTTDGTGTGSFTSSITGLTEGTTYYVRAYATNNVGTAYGNEVSFTTHSLPTVTTTAASSITEESASCGGDITDDGGANVTARGVYWSTSADPTSADNVTVDGTGTGSFSSSITGLNAGTTYYFRAYATNSVGTTSGNEESFTTESSSGCGDPFTDARDGNSYESVSIGGQCWMQENLAYLPSVSLSAVGSDVNPYYYVYGYEENSVTAAKATANYSTYGVLYNWPAAMNGSASGGIVQGICPSGWHLPSDEEWTTLTDFLGTSAGGKMKEAGTAHWASPNTGATNESGFTALPGGYRGVYGGFYALGGYAFFWSSSESGSSYAWYRSLNYTNVGVYRDNNSHGYGFSVRCLQN